MCLTDLAMESKIEIIQINISCEDKPGMTSSLTDILARYDAFILDIGQANIHQSLTLGILFMTTSDKSGAILKELLFKASELGVMIRFTPITEESYEQWAAQQGRDRAIITLLARKITAAQVSALNRAIVDSGLTLSYIKKVLTERGARSVRLATLLDKPMRRRTELNVDYACFDIPNEFVVGYGLDYQEKYRNLPYVAVLHPKIYTEEA